MAMQSFDNVISLAAAQAGQRRRSVKPESFAVINDCRDIAVKRITEVLSKTFDTIEKELFDLAEGSIDQEKQRFYLDARSQARDKRSAIEASFRKQFLSVFEKKVSIGDEAARVSQGDYLTLSLVEDNDLEEKLAMNEIAARLSGKCDEELSALSQRMGFLLSEPEMKEQANPMSPDTVVKALRAACDQMTSGYEAKLAVMKLVEQHMAKEMLGVYHDINAHLIARQIMPQIRPTFRRAQTSIRPKATSASAPSSQTDTNPPTDSHGGMAADIFSTLQQLLAGGKIFDPGMSAGLANPPSHGVTTGSFAPVPPGSREQAPMSGPDLAQILDGFPLPAATTTSLVSALSQLQLQAHGNFSVSGASTADIGAVTAAPVVQQNAVREIKSCGIADGSSQVDAMTIDIVAMLFDFVFDDKAVPDAIKALIARLQIPILKVAILDKSFFSRKNHPARRLLDLLADASVSFVGDATHEDSLYLKTQEVVDCIQADFDTDIQLFSQMVVVFEDFLATREAANAEVIEQSARVLHECEKREMARLIAQDEVERRTKDATLPPPVAAMLIGPWARVLERVYLREGGRDDKFRAALETADNLIWSVSPKSDATERKQLVSLLPTLLRHLKVGMQIAAVENADGDRFFSALVDCHAAAVRAGLRGESVSALLAASHSSVEVAPLFAKLIAEEAAHAASIERDAVARSGLARFQFTDTGVEIEEILPGKRSTEGRTEIANKENGLKSSTTIETPMGKLERGTWVEFMRDSGEKIRAKLSWISPLKGVYLFTNPGEVGALSVAPDALQRQFLSGEARILPESSLVDRAVDNMVHSLSGVMRI
ncbi:MAG: DUF1631 domain-containing protein [Betaproteobacteria bacterium]